MGGAALRLVLVWAALLVLLALTIGATFLRLGPVLPLVSFGIATAKAALVLWFFMELRRENGLARVAALAGFAWLAILFIMTATDNLSRGRFTTAGNPQAPPPVVRSE
jgi:cytochrome c oxidase subunit 4